MESNSASETIIAAEVEIVGTIKTSGSVQFNGKLEGDLHSEGDATVGKSAQVKGNLNVHSISIAGAINGNITAKDRIQMLATARVHGDIKAKRLTVEDGVTFVGRSEVNPSGQPVGGSNAGAPPSYSPGATKAGDTDKSSLFGKK
jgi:cytoskeletal protein CcmA (bactofilin family)